MSTPTSTTLPPQPPAQPNPLVFQPRKVVERMTVSKDGVDMRFSYDLPDGSHYEARIELHSGSDRSMQESREAAHGALRDMLSSRMASMSAHDRLAWTSENHGGANA